MSYRFVNRYQGTIDLTRWNFVSDGISIMFEFEYASAV